MRWPACTDDLSEAWEMKPVPGFEQRRDPRETAERQFCAFIYSTPKYQIATAKAFIYLHHGRAWGRAWVGPPLPPPSFPLFFSGRLENETRLRTICVLVFFFMLQVGNDSKETMHLQTSLGHGRYFRQKYRIYTCHNRDFSIPTWAGTRAAFYALVGLAGTGSA